MITQQQPTKLKEDDPIESRDESECNWIELDVDVIEKWLYVFTVFVYLT